MLLLEEKWISGNKDMRENYKNATKHMRDSRFSSCYSYAYYIGRSGSTLLLQSDLYHATLFYVTPLSVTLRHITLHCITLRYITLHTMSIARWLHCIA